MRLFGSQRRLRGLPPRATGPRIEPVVNVPRETEALQSLARALMAARLGDALMLQAARACRMDDLEQVARR